FALAAVCGRRKLQRPALTVLATNVLFRGGTIGGAEVLGVPGKALADADRDIAEERHFGQWTGVVEVRPGGPAAFAGLDPIAVMIVPRDSRQSRLGRRIPLESGFG